MFVLGGGRGRAPKNAESPSLSIAEAVAGDWGGGREGIHCLEARWTAWVCKGGTQRQILPACLWVDGWVHAGMEEGREGKEMKAREGKRHATQEVCCSLFAHHLVCVFISSCGGLGPRTLPTRAIFMYTYTPFFSSLAAALVALWLCVPFPRLCITTCVLLLLRPCPVRRCHPPWPQRVPVVVAAGLGGGGGLGLAGQRRIAAAAVG